MASLDVRQVLLAPVVSEKSYNMIDENRYTFKVHKDAHRLQVRQAVEELFGVHVLSVNMAKVPAKPKRRGMQMGRKPAWKKAMFPIPAVRARANVVCTITAAKSAATTSPSGTSVARNVDSVPAPQLVSIRREDGVR